MASKCVKKLNEAIASTMTCGNTPRTKSSTSGKPASRNTNPTNAAVMNAITWLRVAADRHMPMARKPPAMRKLPM